MSKAKRVRRRKVKGRVPMVTMVREVKTRKKMGRPLGREFDVMLSLRVPAEAREALQELANAASESGSRAVSSFVRDLIMQVIKNARAEKKAQKNR